MRERHRKKPDAFALRSFLAIAATHDQNADGGSVGKRHRRRRASSVRCGLERFVGNLVLKSSITVVERFTVIIHGSCPRSGSASYKRVISLAERNMRANAGITIKTGRIVCASLSQEAPEIAGSNATPILVSVRHAEWQWRRAPSMTISKLAGMPSVVESCSMAPVSEIFLTVQSSLGALSLKTIEALFNTRLRGAVRLSFMAAFRL